MNVTWMLLLLVGQIGSTSHAPALRCTLVDGTLVVAGLPPLLDDPEVARHLGSGLTATLELVLEARASGARVQAVRRFHVRYEPWDEVYHLSDESQPGDRDSEPSSLADLEAWWRGLELLVDLPGGSGGRRWRAAVDLEVVPFSASEREDAQRWLARSGRRPAETGDQQPSERGGDVGSLLELVMATGIERRAVLGSTWRTDCPAP
jgi:hypothetical protein